MTLRCLAPALVGALACLISCGERPEKAPPLMPGSDRTLVAVPNDGPGATDNSNRTSLFDGQSLAGWSGDWSVADGALVVGNGDLISEQEYGDYHLHLNFRLPDPPHADDPSEFGPGFVPADSGVFLSDRWEVQLADSAGGDLETHSSGAIFGVQAPLLDAAKQPGDWQSLDIRYEHWVGQSAHVSVWLNNQLVQDDVAVDLPTRGGNRDPLPGMTSGDAGAWFMAGAGTPAQQTPWGENDWAVAARFKTSGNGTLVSRCPPMGEWAPDAKALFLRGGRLVYDIGWVGALTSKDAFNDGKWHTVVLRNDGDGASVWVDGELQAVDDDFQADDDAAFTFKIGAANHNFAGAYDGEIEQVRFFEDGLSEVQAREISADDSGNALAQLAATITWQPSAQGGERKSFHRGDALTGPIRLQGGTPGFEFKNIWIRPLEEIDHADAIASLGADAFNIGRQIYNGTCSACHGHDGLVAPNPQARPFASGVLENGSDPYRLYQTVRNGFRDMPPSQWLSPEETYSVVHFLRENFFKQQNRSQYFEVDGAYLAGLPKGQRHADKDNKVERVERDFGPALASQLGDHVGTALTVKLDENTTFCYDLQTMAAAGVWTDGFLNLDNTQHYLQRGEGRAQPGGNSLDMLSGFAWGYQGTLDWDRSLRPPRGPLPKAMLHYQGYSLRQRKVTLSYSIDGRQVHDQPFAVQSNSGPVVAHALQVEAGSNALMLQLAQVPTAILAKADFSTTLEDRVEVEGLQLEVGLDNKTFLANCIYPLPNSLPRPELGVDKKGRVWLRIPACDQPMQFQVACQQVEGSLKSLTLLSPGQVEIASAQLQAAQGTDFPAMWPQPLLTSGVKGSEQPYALDTLTLPASNPWNAWIRTSALDFFDDGRAVVTTYGGDVWIVSGIDAELTQLSWRRFAAGLFEPMGVKVIDGWIYVTCRDRIVRLHDRDLNGEADYYQSFFADPDVSPNFHAFNFDLQVDGDGNLYYAKSGQYTDFNLGGAVIQVAPDGQSHQVYATGLRTPNGMGMSPNGDPLVSDNQGNWIPASKISLVKKDGFYGVFPAIHTSSPGKQTRDTFDPPVIWMPQDFDSSSGGQLWVDDERFGPLSGRYLHTSFGKGWMYPFQIDETANPPQAAIWQLPFQFAAGIQRLRVNPVDGQVYTVGLSGWQGPEGGADGCLQRVRYVGGGAPLLVAAKAVSDGVELEFSDKLNADVARDLDRYQVERWNYLWTRNYGSAHYSVEDPGRQGVDEVKVIGATLSSDGRRLHLQLKSMVPCNQLQVEFQLESAGGQKIQDRVLFTINEGAPPMRSSFSKVDEADSSASDANSDAKSTPWLEFVGDSGPGHGKKVVLVAGDEEYRSEEALPMLAEILAKRFGFQCIVLFSQDPNTGLVDPGNQNHIPGMHHVNDADLLVLFTRFRALDNVSMDTLDAYMKSGRPVIGLRTATHAFNFPRDSEWWPWSFHSNRPQGGFGKHVLGETWVAHHGGHGSESTRGVPEPESESHPILRGITTTWGPTDVYTINDLPNDATVLLRGLILEGMSIDDEPVTDDRNHPAMPVAWIRETKLDNGTTRRVYCSTLASSQGMADVGNRRAFLQACLWCLNLEAQIPDAGVDPTIIGSYQPSPFGFNGHRRGLKPADFNLSER